MDALTPLDGRYADRLEALRNAFGEYVLNKWRVFVELVYFCEISDAVTGQRFDRKMREQLSDLYANFSLKDAADIKKIEAETKHDVKAVEYWVKGKIRDIAPQLNSELVHFGLTSEDVNNLALGLMVKSASENVVWPCLRNIVRAVSTLAEESADCVMLSRTHGQPATPTTMGKELANFAVRLHKAVQRMANVKLFGKCNGAVGNYNALVVARPEHNWEWFCQKFVESLGLEFNNCTTQIEPHDSLCEYLGAVAAINTILLGFVRDIWGYISLGYFVQQTVGSEVGSSTMPHKVNPIDLENAEGNLGMANALLRHMMEKLPMSRFQRDLSDSTVLRNISTALGFSMVAWQSILTGLRKLKVNKELMLAELDQHWELLAEPIQMTMRLYGLDCPYEQLKALTRGVEGADMRDKIKLFITNSALPVLEKVRLQQLTPATYIGLAPQLARQAVLTIRETL